MSIASSFAAFESISDIVGGQAALRLCAFYGPSIGRVYIPNQPTSGRPLEKLIGPKAYAELVQALGGSTLFTPRLDLTAVSNAGRVWSLSRQNISKQQIATLLGLTPTRVSQICKALAADGYGDLDDFENAGLSGDQA